MFPPAPLAAVSAATGNLQVPRAGTLASDDSLSGAPESHKGEAVEQEAHNFVSVIASFAVATAAGQSTAPTQRSAPEEEMEDEVDGPGSALPDPTYVAAISADARDVSHGGRTDMAHDATIKPVETVIWEKARPAMRILADVADTWERFGK